MDGYTLEIDQLHNDLVVLVVPTLRLVVFGRTMGEALSRARASVAFRGLEAGDPAMTAGLTAARTGIQWCHA